LGDGAAAVVLPLPLGAEQPGLREQLGDAALVGAAPERQVIAQRQVGLGARLVAAYVPLPQAAEAVAVPGGTRPADPFRFVEVRGRPWAAGAPLPFGLPGAEHAGVDGLQLGLPVLDGGRRPLDTLAGHRDVTAGFVDLESALFSSRGRQVGAG